MSNTPWWILLETENYDMDKMLRWSPRIFQCHEDKDNAIQISQTLVRDPKDEEMLKDTPRSSSHIVQNHPGYIWESSKRLYSSKGARLSNVYHAKQHREGGNYCVLILGALMMRVGTKISHSELTSLKELVKKIGVHDPSTTRSAEGHLCGPGKVHFTAALDNLNAPPGDLIGPRWAYQTLDLLLASI
ncbi:hypothetical protein BJ170DRAFT_684479 [Xylariales sp. AK1849]|nr:hypothetical protein BJ170DRAFT_684479 [Xylariales sp. AK1849]